MDSNSKSLDTEKIEMLTFSRHAVGGTPKRTAGTTQAIDYMGIDSILLTQKHINVIRMAG